MNNTGYNSEVGVATDPGVLELLQAYPMGVQKQFPAGSVLFRQGDPSGCVFVVKSGAVKVYSLNEKGKEYTYTILGEGRLVGIDRFITHSCHDSTAEVVEEAEIYVIRRVDFEYFVDTNSAFSKAVMKEIAQTSCDLSNKIQDLVFLDVLQRLKYVLMGLAQQYGYETKHGIRIDLNLTHEEIASLVAADRSTTTININELIHQGYLWKERGRFVILPLQHIEILDGLSQSVVEGDEARAIYWARKTVEMGVDPLKALGILSTAMKQVDKGYMRENLALSDVMLAVYATKTILPIIEEQLKKTRKRFRNMGKVVIGTVHGDIHDMGKTIVSILLTSAGFEVIDLGVDVAVGNFVNAVERYRPNILAMSAFLTTTATVPEEVIGILKEEKLRDQVRIIIGGGAMNQELAQRAGGDGYERTADGAVELAKKLVDAK